MSRYAVITLKITATSVFLAAGLVVSTTVYADAIDSKINNNISYGTLLKQKIAQLEQQQQVLLTQKNQLDVDNAQLVKDQEIYNNNVKQYSEQTDIHNQKIAEASRECRSLGPKKNLDQLAQASDTAAAGFSNFPTTNPDARQQEQYVHKCRAKIKEVNSATAHMNAEETSLSDQQQDLEKRSMDIDAKIAAWNQQEILRVNSLNNVYQQINVWHNNAENFMASDLFQAQIVWSHANKVCTTPDFSGASQERMSKISGYIFTCLNTVENMRKKFYARHDEH